MRQEGRQVLDQARKARQALRYAVLGTLRHANATVEVDGPDAVEQLPHLDGLSLHDVVLAMELCDFDGGILIEATNRRCSTKCLSARVFQM